MLLFTEGFLVSCCTTMLLARASARLARASRGLTNAAGQARSIHSATTKKILSPRSSLQDLSSRLQLLQQASQYYSTKDFRDPSAEDDPRVSRLLSSLTKDMEEDLVGKETAKRLRLRTIRADFHFLSNKGYPLPESLSKEQWGRLLGISEKDLRTLYIDSIVTVIKKYISV